MLISFSEISNRRMFSLKKIIVWISKMERNVGALEGERSAL